MVSSKSISNPLQGPKLRLPGRHCDKESSANDQNFTGGRQHATNIATANNDFQIKW